MMLVTWAENRYCWAFADTPDPRSDSRGFVIRTTDYSDEPRTEERFEKLESCLEAMAGLSEKWFKPRSVHLFTQQEVAFYLATKNRFWSSDPSWVEDYSGHLPVEYLIDGRPLYDQEELF